MKNKILLFTGTLFSLFAWLSLYMTSIRTYVGSATGWESCINGFDLIEYSPWGSIVVLIPLLTIACAFSKLGASGKTVMLTVLTVTANVSMYNACDTALEKLRQLTESRVIASANLCIYTAALMLSAISFYICFNLVKEQDTPPLLAEFPDLYKEVFCLYAKPYTFLKYKDDGETDKSKARVVMATEQGYFATLKHPDTTEYHSVEIVSDEEAVGFIMRTMPSGLFGSFYSHDEPVSHKMKILPYNEIKEGTAELWVSDGKADFKKSEIKLSASRIDDIRLFNCSLTADDVKGALVVQNNRLACVVTEYDSNCTELKCISAELIAADLCRMVYEQRVHEAMNKREKHPFIHSLLPQD